MNLALTVVAQWLLLALLVWLYRKRPEYAYVGVVVITLLVYFGNMIAA